MEVVVWVGAALTVVGLVGIVFSIFSVTRAKRAGLSDEDLRARLSKILPINLGALFVSMLGLMAVVVGVLLS